MLAIIVVAALTPNIGVGAAQVNAQYMSTQPTNNTLEYALIGVLVAAIVAAIVGLMIFQRRKKRGGPGAGGVAAWQQPQGGAPSGPSMGGTGGTEEMAAVGGGAGVGAAAGAASYDEAAPAADTGPEWAEPAAPATVSSGAATSGAMDESEPDIDRLMKELDQISDDILKKSPPKKGSPPDAGADNTDSDA
jgi:hypothetical protein